MLLVKYYEITLISLVPTPRHEVGDVRTPTTQYMNRWSVSESSYPSAYRSQSQMNDRHFQRRRWEQRSVRNIGIEIVWL